jgi:hypothetical protein
MAEAHPIISKIMSALARAHDTAVQMIDTSIIRVHQHGACITENGRQAVDGPITSKIRGGRDAMAGRSGSP